MSVTSFKVWVQGQVQGVGFRFHTQAKARALGIRGYAKNLSDGRVEVLAWGEAEQVEALLAWLRAGGPRSARVDQVRAEPCALARQPDDFTVA